MKWKHFPTHWPFVRGFHPSSVNSPHKGQSRGTLMSSLICAWINGWVNNRDAGDLRRHRTHYDVTVLAIVLRQFCHHGHLVHQHYMVWLTALRLLWLYHALPMDWYTLCSLILQGFDNITSVIFLLTHWGQRTPFHRRHFQSNFIE